MAFVSSVPCAPAAPVLEAVDEGSIRVKWAPPLCSPPPTLYRVTVRTTGSTEWKFFDVTTGGLVVSGGEAVKAPLTQCVVRGLTSHESYEATIKAQHVVGWGDMSSVSKALRIGSCVPCAPAAPVLEAVDDGSIRVKWAPPMCSPPPTLYTVRVRTTGTTEWKVCDVATGGLVVSRGEAVTAPLTQCVVGGLTLQESYETTVRVKNVVGWGDNMSSVSLALRIGSCVPCALAAPVLEAVDEGSIRVKWAPPPCSPSPTLYTVRVRTAGSTEWKFFDVATGGLVVSRGGQ